MKIFHKIKTVFTKLKRFPSDLKNFGLDMAWFIFKTNLRQPKDPTYVDKYTVYFEKRFKKIIDSYKDMSLDDCVPFNKNDTVPVWFIWHQGEDSMPEPIRICYERFKMFLPDNAKIEFVKLDNLLNYLPDFPTYIIEKYKKGKIGPAHLSDVIKFALLYKYGGVVYDAGTYVFNKIDERAFTMPFWTTPTEEQVIIPDPCYGKFLVGYLAGQKGLPLFKFMQDMMFAYLKKYNKAIHYTYVFSLLMAGYNNIPLIKELVDAVPPLKRDNCWELYVKINKPFDQEYFNELKSKNDRYKLVTRKPYLEKTEDGKETIWSYIKRTYKDKNI